MDKDFYKYQYGILLSQQSELEGKVKKLEGKIEELETELYFCYRNNKIEKEINDR
jgi:dynactin complex subunit